MPDRHSPVTNTKIQRIQKKVQELLLTPWLSMAKHMALRYEDTKTQDLIKLKSWLYVRYEAQTRVSSQKSCIHVWS